MENKETVFNTEIDKLIDSMDLTQEPPAKEPERQYWFMKKARQLVQEKEKELGRPLRACTVTFGCQMNSRDKTVFTKKRTARSFTSLPAEDG